MSPVEFKAAKDKADGVEGVVEIPKEGSKEDIVHTDFAVYLYVSLCTWI